MKAQELKRRLESLKDDALFEYRKLIEGKAFDFTLDVIGQYKGEEKETVKFMVENEDFNNLYDYDFQEFLTQIYYNDRRGEEKMGYLLGANEEAGLYVLAEQSSRTFYIGFSDLNGLNSKLDVVEAVESKK